MRAMTRQDNLDLIAPGLAKGIVAGEVACLPFCPACPFLYHAAQSMSSASSHPLMHGTTVICVRKGGDVVVAADGQVSLGSTVLKSNANKIRRLAKGSVVAGFAGATADAFTLFERLEGKLEKHPKQLLRACVELAKDWRTDRYLRRLEAMMAVADGSVSLIVSGNGDVLEPEDGLIGIGFGRPVCPGGGPRFD